CAVPAVRTSRIPSRPASSLSARAAASGVAAASKLLGAPSNFNLPGYGACTRRTSVASVGGPIVRTLDVTIFVHRRRAQGLVACHQLQVDRSLDRAEACGRAFTVKLRAQSGSWSC